MIVCCTSRANDISLREREWHPDIMRRASDRRALRLDVTAPEKVPNRCRVSLQLDIRVPQVSLPVNAIIRRTAACVYLDRFGHTFACNLLSAANKSGLIASELESFSNIRISTFYFFLDSLCHLKDY